MSTLLPIFQYPYDFMSFKAAMRQLLVERFIAQFGSVKMSQQYKAEVPQSILCLPQATQMNY